VSNFNWGLAGIINGLIFVGFLHWFDCFGYFPSLAVFIVFTIVIVFIVYHFFHFPMENTAHHSKPPLANTSTSTGTPETSPLQAVHSLASSKTYSFDSFYSF
jgi:hypothetical protein